MNTRYIALIADAGYATRFLPTSKVVPKGLMPLGNFPLILHLLNELTYTNVSDVFLVTSNRMFEIYMRFFSEDRQLMDYLEAKNKTHLMSQFQDITSRINMHILQQSTEYPVGTGAPLLTLFDYLRNNSNKVPDYIFYLFADDVLLPTEVRTDILFLEEMQDLTLSPPIEAAPIGAVLGTQIMPKNVLNKYGIVKPKQKLTEQLMLVETVVEKPPIEKAPSNLAQFGRILLHKKFERYLREFLKNMNTPEFWIQPAITSMAKEYPILAYFNPSYIWLTTGDPFNMAKAWEHWYKIYS